jgi:Flp pilus assembly protein TadB
MAQQANRPILITDAEESLDKQRHSREIRYATMMGLRAICLILAAVLAVAQVPLLPLWLGLCLVGMLLLPWMAVLIANDRPAKAEHRWRHKPPPPNADPRALPTQPTGKTIDIEP